MPERSPIDAWMQRSLFGGTILRLADDGTPVLARRSAVACASGERDELIAETSEEEPTKPGAGAAVAVSVDRDGAQIAPPSEATAPAAQSGLRTSLGTGITKPVGARIDWASLLRSALARASLGSSSIRAPCPSSCIVRSGSPSW